jgi:superfamily II DNA or RNA helicase
MKDQYTYHFGEDDDLLPLEVTTYREFEDTIGFARGDIDKLHEVFGDTIQFDDQRAAVPFGYPLKFTAKLEPEQRETIRDWMARDFGMIKAPPRWGKTVATIALLCKIKQRTLVIAHEHSLLTAWEDELRLHTNINELEEEHGIQLAGFLKKDFFPLITFCTYQRFIHPKGIKLLKKNRDSFGAVVIDEAHLCSAPCFSVVVSSINSFYRIPVTATDKRKDNMHIVSSDIAGPVTAIGRTEQLPVKVVYIPTGYKVKEFKMWTTLINRLARDLDRTQLIAENIVADVDKGRSVVVTTDRVAHVKLLHDFILDIDSNIVIEMVTSRTSPKQRDDIKARAKSGEIQVVIAMNKIIQLGWNVPRWDTLHNTIPMSNEPNWYQRVSRIRTPFHRCPACGWEGVKCNVSGDDGTKRCKDCGSSVVPNKKNPLVRDYIDEGHGAIFATKAIRERVARKFGWKVAMRPAPDDAKKKPGKRVKDIMDL